MHWLANAENRRSRQHRDLQVFQSPNNASCFQNKKSPLNLAIFQYHADAENTATKHICKSLGVQGIIASSKKVRASPSRYY
jgi:hypothetical protein